MRKISPIITMICLALLCGCHSDELPAPTQNGSNTFGMLIDDEKWEPSLAGLFGSPTRGAIFYPDENFVRIYAKDKSRENHQQIEFYISNLNGLGSYRMTVSDPRFDTLACSVNTKFDPNSNNSPDCKEAYFLKDAIDSQVSIARFDTVDRIISGTFEVTLTNNKNQLLIITNGRFDLEY